MTVLYALLYWGTKVWNIEINFVLLKKKTNKKLDLKTSDSDSDSEIIYSDKDYIEYNIIKKNVLMCLGDFC